MCLKIFILVALFIPQILAEKCYTPKNQEGECVLLQKCPAIMQAFANPEKGNENNLKEYICQNREGIHVCCSTLANFTIDAEEKSASTNTDNASETFLREALSRYFLESPLDVVLPLITAKNAETNLEITACVGALINFRYVVTAARCIVPENEIVVRFPLKDQNSFEHFGVEEQILHPFFDPVIGINDIGLLRLNETVSQDIATPMPILEAWSGDFLVPIWLTTFGSLGADLGEKWLNRTTINLDPLSSEYCNSQFKKNKVDAVITAYDRCIDDSEIYSGITCNEIFGVPLFSVHPKMFLVGISNARTVCNDGIPDLYTNVPAYLKWILNNMRTWSSKNKECLTPNGAAGSCRSVVDCPILFKHFSDARNDTKEHLSKFICESKDYTYDISVCCPVSPNSTVFEGTNDLPNLPSSFLDRERCGIQHRDDYFQSQDNVAIDEFPWLAVVQDNSPKGYYLRCGGVLLNARYVLSPAECALGELSKLTVRLGDYDQNNRTACVVENAENGFMDCTESELFGIEKKIVHPAYIAALDVNNIALLRINKTVAYDDYIRPICLPIPGTTTAKPGDALYMSSWGAKISTLEGDIKTKVAVRLITNEDCRQQLRRQVRQDVINSYNLCTIPTENNTDLTTVLDLGGALMTHTNYVWHIEGFLLTNIAPSGLPSKHIKISKYLNWIFDNMRPWK